MKKETLRMCLVCRNMLPKQELIRIVKNSDGNIFVDNSNKASGRGAYICTSDDCFNKIEKQKVLNRAFKGEISKDIYLKVKEEIVDRKSKSY